MQLSRQQQQLSSRRTSPTVAVTTANRILPPASSTRQRSSISSMDSAAVVSDVCDEPLYSRIDHSSSNESQAAPTTSSTAAPNNHDGKAIQSYVTKSHQQETLCPFSAIENLISGPLCPIIVIDRTPLEVSKMHVDNASL